MKTLLPVFGLLLSSACIFVTDAERELLLINEYDADGDGVHALDDCDDNNATVFPGADELCDGVDNNCNDVVDEGVEVPLFPDTDGDGYGDPTATPVQGCPTDALVVDNKDCDDTTSDISPDASEACNTLDDNCDGVVDEGVTELLMLDLDGDGFGDEASEALRCAGDGLVAEGGDCDDQSADRSPAGTEVCNALDDDCDGDTDEEATDATNYYADDDDDSYGDPDELTAACTAPANHVQDATDCDDTASTVFPGAQDLCDGLDNNCDDIDDVDVTKPTWYIDADGDSYGSESVTTRACEPPGSGWVSRAGDCNDSRKAFHPGAPELCNGFDDDCDKQTDEEAVDARDWFADDDGDLYGYDGDVKAACEQPSGYVITAGDCNDADDTVYPGAEDLCDGLANDCLEPNAIDVEQPKWYADADADGYGDADDSQEGCTAPSGYVGRSDDCDDSAAAVHPGASETCDDRDEDCDGTADNNPTDPATWYADADEDGYGDPEQTLPGCKAPDGFVSDDTDCDDSAAGANPGAEEVCDGLNVDEDCDGRADDEDTDPPATSWYADEDEDGFPNRDKSFTECDPAVAVLLAATVDGGSNPIDDDCDDSPLDSDGDGVADGSVRHPDHPEVLDTVDNDCDGVANNLAVEDAYAVITAPSGVRFTATYAIGDLDGDGAAELVVAAHPTNGDADEAWIYSGADLVGPLSRTDTVTRVVGSQNSDIGISADSGCEASSADCGLFLLGEPGAAKVHVFKANPWPTESSDHVGVVSGTGAFGRSLDVDPQSGWFIVGDPTGRRGHTFMGIPTSLSTNPTEITSPAFNGDAGWSVLLTDTYRGDGNPERIIGGPLSSDPKSGELPDTGVVFVRDPAGTQVSWGSGGPDSELLTGERVGSRGGDEMVALGQIDGDESPAYLDFAIAAPRYNGVGAVGIRQGKARIAGDGHTAFLHVNNIFGVASDGRLGDGLTAGDLNGDDAADLVMGAPGEGVVYVLLSADGSLGEGSITTEDIDVTIEAGAEFGLELAAGNFDGAGCDDLVVMTPGTSSSAATLHLFRSHFRGGSCD